MSTRHKSCSIDGCERIAHARDLCCTHLYRYRKYGDPLKLAKPKGVGLRWLLETALHYEGEDCLVWPFTKSGYGIVHYNGLRLPPSRLVCILKYGDPPSSSHESAHSCGRGRSGCVNPSHLRWATPAENQRDRIEHGTSNRGRRGKVTAEDVIWIRSVAGLVSQQEIADKFGMDQSTVSNIMTGKRWSWLNSKHGDV